MLQSLQSLEWRGGEEDRRSGGEWRGEGEWKEEDDCEEGRRKGDLDTVHVTLIRNTSRRWTMG